MPDKQRDRAVLMGELSTKSDRSAVYGRDLQLLIDLILIARDACIVNATQCRIAGATTASETLITRAAEAEELIERLTAFNNGDDRS